MAAASSLARHLPPGAADTGYDYRYEFSETRSAAAVVTESLQLSFTGKS
jgi:hypothetical protein